MDDGFLDRLLNGVKAPGWLTFRSCRKRRTTPPGPGGSGTAKDQG